MALIPFLADVLAPLFRLGSESGPIILSGAGAPEGVVTAPVGSIYLRTDGGSGTTVYNKESGTGNTGWVADAPGAGGSTLDLTTITPSAQGVNDYVVTLRDPAGTPSVELVAFPSGGADPWTYAALASDVTATTATNVATGLSFTADANTAYEVEVFGKWQTTVNTVGIGLNLTIPSGSVIGAALGPSSGATFQGTWQRASGVNINTMTAAATAAADLPIFGKYLVEVGGTGGTVELQLRAETTGATVALKAGFRMKWREI